ncbi:hypothetical protein [Bifidobacterium tissieri]|uniref:Uncharacterized protein n=1 Tax=Bifidobacterium tissieri TaxID=1630162 RepID=A0A5M9ZRD9_9BIFI|nr:hypothetical protein [Bifidobacterium tissieri]KAA8829873.1 hypothetical protein EM849_10900 [Bifidobacterium tissieri]KAA8830498.1 hypothetical protein EMO89_05840 [Bifidobacterium tissieri]
MMNDTDRNDAAGATEAKSGNVSNANTEVNDESRHIGDGEAGRAVLEYVWSSFARYHSDDMRELDYRLIMDDQQWVMVRDLLQQYLAMDDLDNAVQVFRDREMKKLADSCLPDAVPSPASPGLPQGWWTLLEAAYERLGDEEGLRRIYACYIVTDRLPWYRRKRDPSRIPRHGNEIDSAHYVRKLKTLSGEHWPEDVRRMVAVHQRYYRDPMLSGRQLAYEELLLSERLSDAAWRYCKVRCRSRYALVGEGAKLMERMFDIVSKRHAEEACDILLAPLHDADSPMLSNDSPEHVTQIIAVLRKCLPYVENQVREECERLYGMYRHRQLLRSEVKKLLEHVQS